MIAYRKAMLGLFIVLVVYLSILGHAQWSACFPDQAQIGRSISECENVSNLIYSRFELHKLQQLQLFLLSANIAQSSWDIIKFKILRKMMTLGSNFTMVFGGTGVTAGYDNFLHQSYPMLVEKRLNPIFKALGINLIVRNIGQIHVDCRLGNYCFEAMGGTEADFVGWENSFDCGAAKDSHEFIARMAGWKSAVVYFSSSGAFPIDDCPPSDDAVLWISENWLPEKAGISDRITLDAANVQDFKLLHDAWARAGNSAARFVRPLGDQYRGVGAHGFSLWTKTTMKCDYENTYARKSSSVPNRWYSALMDDLARVQAASDANNGQYRNGARTLSDRLSPPPPHAANSSERRLNNNYKRKTPLRSPNITNSTGTLKASAKAKKASPESSFCEAVKLKGRCHADGGPHWRVQESAHFGNALQRGRKWHPTVGMHLLRAEMLVFSYVHIIMDALLMVEADAQRAGALAAVGVVDISKSKNKKKKNKKASKVSSASAVPVGCSAAAEASSKEYELKLKALQGPIPSEPLYCTREECVAMPQCYTDYLPNYNAPHLLSSVIVGSHMGWYVEAAVANDHNPDLGLLDKKFYYKSEGSKNELHLQLSGVRSHVRLYARAKKEPLDEALFILDPHINVARNTSLFKNHSAYRPTQLRYTVGGANYSVEQNYATVPVPAGDHVLTIMTAPSNPFAISSLSHVVVF